MADRQEILRLEELAHRLRVDLCRLCGSYQGNIHMGGDMSMSDVLTCLFHHTMNIDPKDIKMPERDRFILSKGHGAVCMYITMALRGFFDYDEIVATYGKLDSAYGQHPCKVRLPGVETSTGSLGHGLAICVGMAAMLIYQTVINIGMCLYVFPVVGLTLPFFSYGGSSIITLYACMGIVSGIKMRSLPSWLRDRSQLN